MLGTTQRELMSSWRSEDRYAEIDWRDAGQALGLLPFLPEVGEGKVDALDFTEPCLLLGAASSGQQIGLDLVEAGQHLGVDAEHGAAQTRMFMLARGSIRTAAAAQFDFALVEVFLEPEPLGFGDRPVFI